MKTRPWNVLSLQRAIIELLLLTGLVQAASAAESLPGNGPQPPVVTWEVPDETFSTIQPVEISSGTHDNSSTNAIAAFSTTRSASGAGSVRVRFSFPDLGKRSWVRVTSLADGASQNLDAEAMRNWENTSAYFNGEDVRVELFVAAGETNIAADIASIIAYGRKCPECETTLPAGRRALRQHNINGPDDRVSSSDFRVGRITGCTAWLISNGAVLTAGHCAAFRTDPAPQVLEVNVPNGNPRSVHPDDQFPVDRTRLTFRHVLDTNGNLTYDDWCIFGIRPNAKGERAHVKFGFFCVTMVTPGESATIRITGYGIDTDTPAMSRTLQTSVDSFRGRREANRLPYFAYATDTEPGTSGGPIIWEETGFAIGINTASPIENIGENYGISFENAELRSAVHNWLGNDTIYVDSIEPPGRRRAGTIFDPAVGIEAGYRTAFGNKQLAIIAGDYTVPRGFTMGADNRGSVTLIAPVGTVTIGAP